MEVVTKQSILQAYQWQKNGDIPGEVNEVFTSGPYAGQYYEGSVVRYYRNPGDPGERVCDQCHHTMHEHGWIDKGDDGVTVCPGDIVIKLSDDTYTAMSLTDFREQYIVINEWSFIFGQSFQQRAYDFFITCFKEEFPDLITDKVENQHRFMEESLEFVQSLGMSKDEVLSLVDYVFSRPIGDPHIEAGGVATTYSILCKTHGIDVIEASENELIRNYQIIDTIRAKQKQKNKLGIKPNRVFRLKECEQ